MNDVSSILSIGQSTTSGTTNVTSKLYDFWKDFDATIKQYITDLADDDVDYVTIDGKQYQKGGAAELAAMDKLSTDITTSFDSILKNIKTEMDLETKMYSLFS